MVVEAVIAVAVFAEESFVDLVIPLCILVLN